MTQYDAETQKHIDACEASFAIQQLGSIIKESNDCAGFEGITSSHWSAIGIAIEKLSDLVHPEEPASTKEPTNNQTAS